MAVVVDELVDRVGYWDLCCDVEKTRRRTQVAVVLNDLMTVQKQH